MQEELIKVLSLPMCNIQHITLSQANLKADFLQRLLSSFQASKPFKQYSLISSTNGKTTNSFTSFKSVNLSRNSIEDKGLTYLAHLFKEFPILSNLSTIVLTRCGLSTKSINLLFASIPSNTLLTHLDFSFNNLKEEPVVGFDLKRIVINLNYCNFVILRSFTSI
jgi:hypothetical protein